MDKKKLLFLCTGNSCRSQMAEGLARQLKAEKYEVLSAGVETHGLNPHAVQVMSEVGIDISQQTSNNIDEYQDIEIDYVVSVCDHAADTCPSFPATTARVHQAFDDPPKLAQSETDPEKALDHYRRVRDDIKRFIENIDQVLS